jgi:hypothetical protein
VYLEFLIFSDSIPEIQVYVLFVQALQLGQDAFNPYELRSQRCQMCLRTDSLHKVMERLASPGFIFPSFFYGSGFMFSVSLSIIC